MDRTQSRSKNLPIFSATNSPSSFHLLQTISNRRLFRAAAHIRSVLLFFSPRVSCCLVHSEELWEVAGHAACLTRVASDSGRGKRAARRREAPLELVPKHEPFGR